MKYFILTLILFFFLIGCTKSENDSQNSNHKVVEVKAESEQEVTIESNHNSSTQKVVDFSDMQLDSLKKLFVIGDFTGNGIQDTIFQHAYSQRTQEEMMLAPSPTKHNWKDIVSWFSYQEVDIILTMNTHHDTLHLGNGQGLYCLINVGDNNQDGKDEIALSVDRLDFSMLNSCKIYSSCNNQWKLVRYFQIHEDSFNWGKDEKQPNKFKEIKNYLEKKEGKWFSRDYKKYVNAKSPKDTLFVPLVIDVCK